MKAGRGETGGQQERTHRKPEDIDRMRDKAHVLNEAPTQQVSALVELASGAYKERSVLKVPFPEKCAIFQFIK